MFVVDLTPPGATKRKQIRRRGFATRRAAQEALDEVKGSVKRGEYVEPRRLTVGAYFDVWLGGLPASGKRPTTVDSYRRLLRAHLLGHEVASIAVQALTAVDLDRLYSYLLTNGGKDRTGVSMRTVRYVHAVVRKGLGTLSGRASSCGTRRRLPRRRRDRRPRRPSLRCGRRRSSGDSSN